MEPMSPNTLFTSSKDFHLCYYFILYFILDSSGKLAVRKSGTSNNDNRESAMGKKSLRQPNAGPQSRVSQPGLHVSTCSGGFNVTVSRLQPGQLSEVMAGENSVPGIVKAPSDAKVPTRVRLSELKAAHQSKRPELLYKNGDWYVQT